MTSAALPESVPIRSPWPAAAPDARASRFASRRDAIIGGHERPGAGADHAVYVAVRGVQREGAARVDVHERLPRDVDAMRHVLHADAGIRRPRRTGATGPSS